MPTNAELTTELEAAKARTEQIARAVDEQGDALEALQTQSAETQSTMAEILKVLNGMSAQARPTEIPRHVDTEATAFLTGVVEGEPDSPELIQPALLDVDSPEFKAKAEMLKFMEEVVEVYIHETSDTNADQNFLIGVNGRQMVFQRGQRRRCMRMFVEGLARAKPRSYSNEEFTMNDGRRAYRYPVRAGLRYPFTVTDDPNPRGAAWLERILKEPS